MAVRVADKIKQINDADFYLMDAKDIEYDGRALDKSIPKTVSKKSDLPENASNSAVYIVLGDTEDNNGVYLYLNDEWYKLSMTKASEASADTTAVVGKAIAGKAIVGT